jgi:hypothetical protein
MLTTDLIGERGENALEMRFLRAINGHNGFDPVFLGAKVQLLDYRVALLDSSGKAFGPHFYVQVKTHNPTGKGTLSVGWDTTKIDQARAGIAPVFIAGVELVSSKKEKVWICGVTTQTKLSSILKKHSLENDNTLIKLYGDVLDYYKTLKYGFSTSLT